MLASDAVAAGVLYGGGVSESDAVIATGLGMYWVGAPLVHLANRNPRGAEASAGLRLAGPLIGGVVALAVGEAACGTECGVRAGLYGAGLGMLASSVLDIAVLSKTQPAEAPLFISLSAGSF